MRCMSLLRYDKRDARPDLKTPFVRLAIANDMYIFFGQLDDAFFLYFFYRLYDFCP